MSFPFQIERLANHRRDDFDCGEPALDDYLATRASQDMRRLMAVCFVATESATGRIAAYYTLASASIPFDELSPEIARKLPRYPVTPAARIGRLAVDNAFKGKGLGGALLADAAMRMMKSDAAAFALIVDAKNESAVRFYEHHGFIRLRSKPDSLFAPVSALCKST